MGDGEKRNALKEKERKKFYGERDNALVAVAETVRQVDPEFNPDQVMGPGDDSPRAMTPLEREAFGLTRQPASPVDLCICGPKTRGEHGCLCSEPYSEKGHFAHPNSARFHELLKQAGEMHDRKQADYGRGDDPFANVRASEEWGIAGWVGAMVRAQDKVRRLQTHSTRGSLVNESVADSLLDLAVYALIALVLYEQDTLKG